MGKTHSFDFRKGSLICPISGISGTLNGGAQLNRTDKGIALDVDGVQGRVDLSEAITFPIYTAETTFEIWYKERSSTKAGESKCLFGDATLGYYKMIYLTATGIYIESNTTSDLAFGTTSTDSQWRNLIITADSGTVQMYINGSALSMSDSSVTADVTLVRIGNNGAYVYPFNGFISRIQAWDHILTAEERAKLYQEFLRATPITKAIR